MRFVRSELVDKALRNCCTSSCYLLGNKTVLHIDRFPRSRIRGGLRSKSAGAEAVGIFAFTARNTCMPSCSKRKQREAGETSQQRRHITAAVCVHQGNKIDEGISCMNGGGPIPRRSDKGTVEI